MRVVSRRGARTLLKLESRRTVTQPSGQLADLAFAEEEGGQNWYQPLGRCWKAVPGWGRALLPLWACVSFLALADGPGESGRGTYLVGELEVGRGLQGGQRVAARQLVRLRGGRRLGGEGPAARYVCDGDLQKVPGSDKVSEAEPGLRIR